MNDENMDYDATCAGILHHREREFVINDFPVYFVLERIKTMELQKTEISPRR